MKNDVDINLVYEVLPQLMTDETGTKARKVNISIGRQNPQQYEITGGLQAGDKVIVTGYSTFGDAEELILK